MYRLILHHLSIIYICLLVHNYIVDARFTVKSPNNTVVSYLTQDYILYNQPYYKYSGVSIYWPWKKNITDCTMEHGSRISNYTSETIDQLRSSRATTIVVSNLSAHTSGCRTVAEVGNAVEKLSQQLVDLGFPPIKLFVFMDTVKLLTPDDSSVSWNLYSPWFRAMAPSVPDGLPIINVSLLDAQAAKYITSVYSKGATFEYTAEQEAGPWNDLFLSAGYSAYKWLLFLLVICALLYAFARLFRLIQLWILPKRLQLSVFAIACLASISYLMYNQISRFTYKGMMIYFTCSFLNDSTLCIILLYWSIHAASFFPKLLMLCFRTGVFLNLFLQILSFIIYVLLYSNQIAFVEGSWVSFMYDYSQFITYSINIVTFGTFIIWFAYSMHKLRQHSEARSKFLQLLLFSITACFVYVFILTYSAIARYKETHNIAPSYRLVFSFIVMEDAMFFVQSTVCLTVLGIMWPTQRSNKRIIIEATIHE